MNRRKNKKPVVPPPAEVTNQLSKEELEESILDRYDVERMFKVSPGTVNNWCKKGILKFVKFGGKKIFNANFIRAKLKQYEQVKVPGEERKKK